MRFMSPRLNGAIDYLAALLLIASPWLFGFADGGTGEWLSVLLGTGMLIYSALTDYEPGLAPVLPMRVHLGLDGASGALLVSSPWLMGFGQEAIWPHVTIGLCQIVNSLATRPGTASQAS